MSSTYPSMHSKQSSFRTLGDLSEITSSGSVRTYLPPSSSTGGPSSLSCDGVMASLVRAPPARSAVAHPSQWATLLLSPPSLPSSFSLLHLAAPPQHSHTSHTHMGHLLAQASNVTTKGGTTEVMARHRSEDSTRPLAGADCCQCQGPACNKEQQQQQQPGEGAHVPHPGLLPPKIDQRDSVLVNQATCPVSMTHAGLVPDQETPSPRPSSPLPNQTLEGQTDVTWARISLSFLHVGKRLRPLAL